MKVSIELTAVVKVLKKIKLDNVRQIESCEDAEIDIDVAIRSIEDAATALSKKVE